MQIFENQTYKDDIRRIVSQSLPWDRLDGKTVLISGSTGLIGSVLVDALMTCGASCYVIAISRNKESALERFGSYFSDRRFKYLQLDVNDSLPCDISADYIFHLASCTHPVAYASKPIDTIWTNISGTRNMLEVARRKADCRFIFASSIEIYGVNRGDIDIFDENYCGYIDSNSLRAGYPESKRCGEALCQAYSSQYDIDVVIPRLCRCFGPTLKRDDSKALSQFLWNAVHGQDIVLKSKGDQYFSYIYAADAVSALLTIMLKGEKGEAYNISSPECDITLKDLAKMISRIAGTNVVFELPDNVESAGFSKATTARLDPSKIMKLGWKPVFGMEEALSRSITCLQSA